eukprot:scaffold71316_cov25-Tisochrysis_lutea.AAC.1
MSGGARLCDETVARNLAVSPLRADAPPPPAARSASGGSLTTTRLPNPASFPLMFAAAGAGFGLAAGSPRRLVNLERMLSAPWPTWKQPSSACNFPPGEDAASMPSADGDSASRSKNSQKAGRPRPSRFSLGVTLPVAACEKAVRTASRGSTTAAGLAALVLERALAWTWRRRVGDWVG